MKFFDYFTYRDRAGNRRLRRFTIATALLALVVLLIVGAAFYNQAQVRAVAEATPSPVAVATVTPRPEPTATSEPVVEECPTDPGDWAFVEYESGQHLRRIEPACVYDEVARTVAWYQATAYGYSGPEAAEALGFEPRTTYDVRVPLNLTTGVFTTTSSYRAKRRTRMWIPFTPLLPEYRQWWVDDAGQPSDVKRALIGCFRAADVVSTGSAVEVKPWQMEYPAMCWVRAVVSPGHLVQQLDGSSGREGINSHTPPASQKVALYNELYGATPDGQWIYLGRDADFSHDVAPGELGQTLSVFTGHHNLPVWDRAWLQKTFGLTMQPLPNEWQQWSNQSQQIVERGQAIVHDRFTPDQ